jgi:hypothetical protein
MKLRTGLLGLAAALGAATLASSPVAAAMVDIDAYAWVNVPVSSSGSVTVGPVTVTWTISIPITACSYFSYDGADGLVPEAGIAGSCSGSGVLTYTGACGNGILTGMLNIQDGGGSRSVTLTGVMTGFVGTLAGTTNGTGVATGQLAMTPQVGQTCASGITNFTSTGSLSLAGA